MGVSPKWVKSKRRREKERLHDGDNNGQAMHGARKHAWRTQAAWANCYATQTTKEIHILRDVHEV